MPTGSALRALNLGPRRGGERHRNETEAGEERGHEHGPEPGHCAFHRSVPDSPSFVGQLEDVTDDRDAVNTATPKSAMLPEK